MILTLHGQVTLYGNILTDVRLAREAGYAALELHTDKLDRYLAAGLPVARLKESLAHHGIKAACIDIIGDIERQGPAVAELEDYTDRLCRVAAELECPTIQINPFCALEGREWSEIREKTAANMRRIADIGGGYGIRFQLEGAAWTPVHTLSQCLEVIETADRENLGLVIDYWHFWAGRGGTPDEIARLDKSLIYGVHLCDGFRPAEGAPWPDERELRGVLPGDGELPVAAFTRAVADTGFDGFISGEFLNHRLWERDLLEVSVDMRQRMEAVLKPLGIEGGTGNV